MKADLGIVYSILRSWAIAGQPRTYTDLSTQYYSQTGQWFEPHGTWDSTLGDLNQVLATASAPAISALVILKGKNEPGGGFWGCAPNVPRRPKDETDRIAEWLKIVGDIKSFQWPDTIPVRAA